MVTITASVDTMARQAEPFQTATGGDYAFGGDTDTTASGDFRNCTGGLCLRGKGTANGEFPIAQGPEAAFGGWGGTASGTFTDCNGGYFTFGGKGGTASGEFTDCSGGQGAFGGDGGLASGRFTNCTGIYNAFGGGAGGRATGRFTNCVGSSYAFGTGPGGSSLNARLRNCQNSGAGVPEVALLGDDGELPLEGPFVCAATGQGLRQHLRRHP